MPVHRFVNTTVDFKGNFYETWLVSGGLMEGGELYDLGVTFKYEDGASDPARNKLTLTAACSNWIQASPFRNGY